MLHGAAGSWTTWTPLLQAAERDGIPLSDVVLIDLPGWGDSRVPTATLDIPRVGAAVREVADALGYDRWMLVGHSLGGLLALDVAARSPARTDGVLLVSPTGPAVLDAIRRPVRGGIRLRGFAGMLLAMRFLSTLGGAGTGLVTTLHRAGLMRALGSPLFADPAHVHRTVIDALAREIRPRSFSDAARAAAVYDESIWHGIRCPVRALRGVADVFVGPDDAAGFAAVLPDFAQTTLPAAGHFAAVEQPARVLDELRVLAQAAHSPQMHGRVR